MSDAINPDHYKRLPAEAIEIIESAIQNAPDNIAAYNHGQQLKYDLRLFEKGKTLREYLIDQEKHCWYSDRLREHLRKLVEQEDKCEQQKDADQQSLKDHPFGKLRQPKWTPKVGDWVRIKNIDPREAWMPEMDKYDGKIVQVEEFDGRSIVHDEWCFLFDWLEPAEQPAIKQPTTPEPPDGWRWLEVGEVIRKGDRYFDGKQWKDRDWAIKETYSLIHQKTIRRNRFEVGEKVMQVSNSVVYKVIRILSMGYQLESEFCAEVILYGKDLAPYIEETK